MPVPVIAVFDSGVGGLSVASEIAALLPGAELAYVCDNGFFPYGTKRQAMAATPLEPSFNPLMYRVKHPNDAARNLVLYARFLFDAMRGRRARMDMRRSSYTT